jgi:PAS domain S-box-containing protein
MSDRPRINLQARLAALIDQIEAGSVPGEGLQDVLLRSAHSLSRLEHKNERMRGVLRQQVEEQHQGLEALDTVRELMDFLGSAKHCDALFDGLPALVKRVFRADAASLMLLNTRSDALELVGASGKLPKTLPEPILRGQGVAGAVLASGRARLSSDTALDPAFIQKEGAPRSLLSIPLGSPEPFAVLNLSSQTPMHFHRSHRDLLAMLASPISLALSHARLEASFQQELRGQTKELEDVRDFFQSIVNSSDDLIVVLSPEFDMILVSSVVSRMLQYSSTELADKPLAGTFLSVDKVAQLQESLESAQSLRDLDVQLRHADGSPVHVSLNASPIFSGEKKILGYLCIFRSIERRVRTHRELTRLNERLNALFDASLEIGSSLELDSVLGRVLTRVKHLLDADDGKLLLVTADGAHLQSWRSAEEGLAALVPISACPEGIVFRQQKPLLLAEPAAVRQFLPEANVRIQSCLMVPLRLKDTVVGVLRVDSHDMDHFFDMQDLRLGSTFATQAALSIENSRLFSAVAEESDRLRGLLELTRQASAQATPQKILDHFAQGAMRLTHSVAVLAWEYRADENAFFRASVHAAGVRPSELPSHFSDALPPSDPFSHLIHSPKDPMRVQTPTANAYPWALSEIADSSRILILPVAAHSKLLGVLLLYSSANRDEIDQDLDFAQVLAMQAGSMIQACHLLMDNQSAREFLSSVMSSATDAVVVTDRQGRVTLFNPGAEKMIGVTQDNVLGRRLPELFPDVNQHIWRMRRVLREGASQFSVETELRTQEGGSLAVQLSLSWLKDARGRINGILGVAKDNSQFKKLAEVRHEADRLKSIERLAVTVSDKINSPLAVILGQLDLLRLMNSDLGDPSLQSLNAVSEQVNRIKEILNSLDQLKQAQLKTYALPDVEMYDLEPDERAAPTNLNSSDSPAKLKRKAPNRRLVPSSSARKREA